MCSKPPVEACHFSVVHIVWCSEGPCEPSTEYQFTDLDPKPHEIEKRGTDFTFYLYTWEKSTRTSRHLLKALSTCRPVLVLASLNK